MRGGHEWLIFPLRQDSFVKSFSCQNEASALFSCCSMAGVMSQSTWEGCRPGKHGVWKWRWGVVMDALSSLHHTRWHMFNLSPAAPVDRAGWDFTPLWSCVCGMCVSEWVKGSVRYRLKERKVTGRKSEPRKREEKWINKAERPAFQFLSGHLYIAQNQITKTLTYMRSAFGSSNWNLSALLTLNCFNEFHNFGSNCTLPEPMTAWRTTRHKGKSEKKNDKLQNKCNCVSFYCYFSHVFPPSVDTGMCVGCILE